jgi:rod shape-determining protein MreC
MERLFKFIFEYRAFFTFLLLALLCAWMIVENNQYQSTTYFNTSNRIAANVVSTSKSVKDYFALRDINTDLANENAILRKKLDHRNQQIQSLELSQLKDTAILNRYDYVSAKVINNSTRQYKNFITINRGETFGVEPGMGVISQWGVIGKVKSVSANYAVLISLLNIDDQVSSKIKRTGHFGTVQWDGLDAKLIEMKYIPRHVSPLVGDTIVTSGYNAVFPEGILIGIIKEVKLAEESPFHQIRVELSQDFGKLSFVEVVKSNLKKEQDSLEVLIKGIPK